MLSLFEFFLISLQIDVALSELKKNCFFIDHLNYNIKGRISNIKENKFYTKQKVDVI